MARVVASAFWSISDSNNSVMASDEKSGVVIVSLKALNQAFYSGLIENMKIFNNDFRKATIVNSLMEMMFQNMPLPDTYKDVFQNYRLRVLALCCWNGVINRV
jgi:hypothetical protein